MAASHTLSSLLSDDVDEKGVSHIAEGNGGRQSIGGIMNIPRLERSFTETLEPMPTEGDSCTGSVPNARAAKTARRINEVDAVAIESASSPRFDEADVSPHQPTFTERVNAAAINLGGAPSVSDLSSELRQRGRRLRRERGRGGTGRGGPMHSQVHLTTANQHQWLPPPSMGEWFCQPGTREENSTTNSDKPVYTYFDRGYGDPATRWTATISFKGIEGCTPRGTSSKRNARKLLDETFLPLLTRCTPNGSVMYGGVADCCTDPECDVLHHPSSGYAANSTRLKKEDNVDTDTSTNTEDENGKEDEDTSSTSGATSENDSMVEVLRHLIVAYMDVKNAMKGMEADIAVLARLMNRGGSV